MKYFKFSKGVLVLILVNLIVVNFSFLSGCSDKTRPELQFAPNTLPEAHVGQKYTASVKLSNNETPFININIQNGELPQGLTYKYNEHDNYITVLGIPVKSGQFKFTVNGYCYGTNVSGQSGSHIYELVITN